MATILWIIAALLVISGIFAILRKQLVWGIVLIVVGCLVGPGGVSIFISPSGSKNRAPPTLCNGLGRRFV